MVRLIDARVRAGFDVRSELGDLARELECLEEPKQQHAVAFVRAVARLCATKRRDRKGIRAAWRAYRAEIQVLCDWLWKHGDRKKLRQLRRKFSFVAEVGESGPGPQADARRRV